MSQPTNRRSRMVVSVAVVVTDPEIIGDKSTVETFIALTPRSDMELAVALHGSLEAIKQQMVLAEQGAGLRVPDLVPGMKLIK